MKKRILCTMITVMLIVSMAACSKKTETKDNTPTLGAEQGADSYDVEDYNKYVTLADYKGMAVEIDRSTLEVTEEEIQQQINMTLSGYATVNEIREGVVADGDTVNMDFSGLLDGIAFSNGTATDFEYTIGGGFIEDLDRGLIGLEVGKEYEIPCTFPANYSPNPDLAGKDVIFVVTVNYIEEYIYPEYNDEFVKMVAADNDMDMSTTEEMTADIRDFLVQTKLDTFNEKKYNIIISQILDETEFKEMPQSEYLYLQNTVRNNMNAQFETYGTAYGAADVESFYQTNMASMYGYPTLDEFITGYSMDYLEEKMVITLIAQNEDLVVSEDEITEYGTQIALNNGYESYDAVLKEFGDVIIEEFRYTLLQGKVFDYLVENTAEK